MTVDERPENPASETRSLHRARSLTFQRFRIEVASGPDQGVSQVAQGAEFSIGTAEGNHLVLTDRTVSRHHCVITCTSNGFLVRDLGSTNGTFVGGHRIEAAYLRPGSSLAIGKTTCRFEGLNEVVTEPLSDESQYGRLLGESAAMRRIFALLPKIAMSESTVLLEGETGTGKGLLAEAIHANGPRAPAPFVVVDCSAIPSSLVEAELFGHAKGAFTGALNARLGVFETANGGTVFLDEIGELPLDMQPKLLRAIEERTIRRVGSASPTQLNVRIIAATNRDLRNEVNRGTFRSDLYYRLNIVRLRLPPLRERREDIPVLAEHFYRHFTGNPDARPPTDWLTALLHHEWPGNVRELRGAVERAVLMEDPALLADALPSPAYGGPNEPSPMQPAPAMFDPSVSFREAKERAVAQWERVYLESLLKTSGANLSRAARLAHMNRNHLRDLLKLHGISARDDDAATARRTGQ